MLQILVSVNDDGEMWYFHWDGENRTPFSQEEMNAFKKSYAEYVEERAAKIYNDSFNKIT